MEMTRVSCEYGMKRVTQEKGCYMHKAVDLAGMPRTVVWAPQDGIVVIKNKYKSSGNTVVIDHGLGIFTLLFHLDSFSNVNVGDKIRRGSPVGKMGMTGYATGYHLHWEMRINNIHVDPLQWTKLDF
jgi:murein DD-endopeptidase MepM/ murein hydrolase activator NlpD